MTDDQKANLQAVEAALSGLLTNLELGEGGYVGNGYYLVRPGPYGHPPLFVTTGTRSEAR